MSILGPGECLATRLSDANQLSLNFTHATAINQLAQADRMDWELWIESAPSFKDLKQQLANRGFRGMPMNDKPELFRSKGGISADTLTGLPNQQKMMRRKSRQSR